MSQKFSVVPKSSTAALAAASLRVAVIDDEPDAVLMLLTLLRSEGCCGQDKKKGRALLDGHRVCSQTPLRLS